MIEKQLISFLINKTQAGSYIYAERPNDIPEKYILIQKTGSYVEDMIPT